jgi:hypothetical protein
MKNRGTPHIAPSGFMDDKDAAVPDPYFLFIRKEN